MGAFEVINKIGGNFTDDDEQALIELARHAQPSLGKHAAVRSSSPAAQQQIADQAEQGVRLIGECPAIAALRSTIGRVADTDLAVLILGENGTGKEVAAQMIHYHSRRRQEPLVAVNCAAITETLLESELFGHEKGAFTDAREMRRGKFELAASGTLFLDEIGDMSLAGQAKLLRVLEEKIDRSRRRQHADSDEYARDCGDESKSGRAGASPAVSRGSVFSAERRHARTAAAARSAATMCMLLAEHFLKHFAARPAGDTPKFTAAARKRLLAHAWPGNVRELRNLMERLAYLAPEEQDKIDAPDLAFIMSPDNAAAGALSLDLPLAEATHEFQMRVHQAAHRPHTWQHDGRRRKARPAPQQPVSQNEAARPGDGRVTRRSHGRMPLTISRPTSRPSTTTGDAFRGRSRSTQPQEYTGL